MERDTAWFDMISQTEKRDKKSCRQIDATYFISHQVSREARGL